MKSRAIHLIFGSQLFPIELLCAPLSAQSKNAADEVPHITGYFMAETHELCSYYKFHKHKLILFLASMRHYRDNLEQALSSKSELTYHQLSDEKYEDLLLKAVKAQKCTDLIVWEIEDKFMELRVQKFAKQNGLKLTIRPSPQFLHSRDEFTAYLKSVKKPFMKTFYERSRKSRRILMTSQGKPEGDQFSFDEDNRKKLPNDIEIPKRKAIGTHLYSNQADRHVQAVKELVTSEFASHPGDANDFWLPTTRKGWLEALTEFSTRYFASFGDYEDSITNREPFLFHSVLSPGLNLGWITPNEVIEAATLAWKNAKTKKSDLQLNSVEGFIRQVLGWREFVRGIYQNFSEQQDTTNFWGHQRKLTAKWYNATTGLPPVDDAIRKVQRYGYNHHIERLMIISNAMLLSEIHPNEVHRWFMEMYVDSSDWVMGPNVYGMGQFSDGGVFATKPYISGSNYILKMSDYKKGDWCEVMDSLYWTFILKHRSFYEKNPRMSVMTKALDKMDKAKISRMMQLAERFRET